MKFRMDRDLRKVYKLSSSSWHVLGLEACYGLGLSLRLFIGRPIDLSPEIDVVKFLLEIFQRPFYSRGSSSFLDSI